MEFNSHFNLLLVKRKKTQLYVVQCIVCILSFVCEKNKKPYKALFLLLLTFHHPID